MRRSIAELCLADHANDPAILSAWLANKTPEIVAGWIARPDNHFFVACEGDAIRAVAAMTSAGEIRLNYVAPEARFRGISRALLRTLEDTAHALGQARCTLTSRRRRGDFIAMPAMRRAARQSGPSAARAIPWRRISMLRLAGHDAAKRLCVLRQAQDEGCPCGTCQMPFPIFPHPELVEGRTADLPRVPVVPA
jgi:GNAT superfamily N-acetyltransferase